MSFIGGGRAPLRPLVTALAAGLLAAACSSARQAAPAPARDGGVWFTAQAGGYLGHLDPRTRSVTSVQLGEGARPHGVITAPDGTVWVTDGGLNAIVRVDAASRQVRRFPLPPERPDASVHTATLDRSGTLWFTGQSGVYGRLDPRTGRMQVYDAPGGPGPYGITTTPGGDVYYASLAGSYIARIDRASGRATRDPATGQWREWRLPGDHPQPYAVFVDDSDIVWASDFGANRLVGFDPVSERFTTVALPGPNAAVRQLLGRPGQVLGAASALDRLLILSTGA